MFLQIIYLPQDLRARRFLFDFGLVLIPERTAVFAEVLLVYAGLKPKSRAIHLFTFQLYC